MPRGGFRQGAGRKSTWASGRSVDRTVLVRVPTEYRDEILAIAHKLDAGQSLDFETKSQNDSETESEKILKQVKSCLSRWKKKADSAGPKNGQWLKARVLIPELEKILYGLNNSSEDNSVLKPVNRFRNNDDLETESKLGRQLSLLDLDTKSKEEPKLLSLSNAELARRLKVSTSLVIRYRNGSNRKSLEEWSRSLDSEGISWRYDKRAKRYYPTP